MACLTLTHTHLDLNPAPRINGLTHLNITKLDVLSDLAEIKIGLRYKASNGDTLKSVPADLETLEAVSVRHGGVGCRV